MSIIKLLAIIFIGVNIGSGFGIAFMAARCMKRRNKLITVVIANIALVATICASAQTPALVWSIVVGLVFGLLALSLCAINGDDEEYHRDVLKKEMERCNVE